MCCLNLPDNAFCELGSSVKIEPLPKTVLDLLKRDPSKQIPEADLSKVDDKLVNALLPFQREGVK